VADERAAADGAGFDITPLGNGRYRVSNGTRQRVAYAAGPPHSRWIFLSGRVYVIDTTGGSDHTGRRAQDDETALASPMPATVASIHVAEGQSVARGDLLVMLEAMKMEMPIRAPHNGRVKTIACALGELVQPGIRLVELEPDREPEPRT
jgi:3-methylcrotonyl-CoA carboxylase alpha subunit